MHSSLQRLDFRVLPNRARPSLRTGDGLHLRRRSCRKRTVAVQETRTPRGGHLAVAAAANSVYLESLRSFLGRCSGFGNARKLAYPYGPRPEQRPAELPGSRSYRFAINGQFRRSWTPCWRLYFPACSSAFRGCGSCLPDEIGWLPFWLDQADKYFERFRNVEPVQINQRPVSISSGRCFSSLNDVTGGYLLGRWYVETLPSGQIVIRAGARRGRIRAT